MHTGIGGFSMVLGLNYALSCYWKKNWIKLNIKLTNFKTLDWSGKSIKPQGRKWPLTQNKKKKDKNTLKLTAKPDAVRQIGRNWLIFKNLRTKLTKFQTLDWSGESSKPQGRKWPLTLLDNFKKVERFFQGSFWKRRRGQPLC